MTAYKYISADRVDVLEKSSIRFTQPIALNDPFETMPCFALYKEQLRDKYASSQKKAAPSSIDLLSSLIDNEISKIPEKLSQHFGILSLSKQRNHLLMWSHYADSHRGFVLGFDTGNPFFWPGNGKGIDGLRPVVYSDKRAIVPREGLSSLDFGGLAKANEFFFFTKSSEWSYEEELRILAFPGSADEVTKDRKGLDVYLFRFPSQCVKEVILGYRADAEMSGRIASIVERRYSEANLYRIQPNERHFRLDIVPFVA